jgi:hypothetical protein
MMSGRFIFNTATVARPVAVVPTTVSPSQRK